MKRIVLGRGDMKCLVLPEYGGMVGGLWIGDVPVLRMDEGRLGLGNVLSGGIPVLFPFAGRCAGGQVRLAEQDWFMPMHGYAKDLPFQVSGQWDDGCTLKLELRGYAPYEKMSFALNYRLEERALVTTARVYNGGQEALPMALGFHPYFRVEDRAGAHLDLGLTQYLDYLAQPPRQGALTQSIDLKRDWDHVFFGHGVLAQLTCPAEGYAARLTADSTFKAVTLCTTQPGAVCVEPWQAPPDALAQGRARWLPPGRGETLGYRIALKRL